MWPGLFEPQLVASSKINMIPDCAVPLVNLRTYDMAVGQRMIDSIERMVRAECEASGRRRPTEFEYYDQCPFTYNNPEVTESISVTSTDHFGAEKVFDHGLQTVSEDFSALPDAFGKPYTYWGGGCTDQKGYESARQVDRIEQDIPVNQSESFAPVIEPTLSIGTQTVVVAALTNPGK